MSTNGISTAEDADMSEGDGETIVTMMDVLKEQEDFEDDANAVLGASDEKNCTYSKGYVKRQAIYACLTCCPDAKTDPTKRAGVCLACSLNCHENHELVELYTKRNFRCDCGNPKFNSHPCTFTPNKTDLNYENRYNQNFSGIYCVCHRPYPDPEATDEEEMIQCIICEDWLHCNHLEATVPQNDQYSEMVCKDCMEDNDFLHDYTDIVVNTVDKEIIITDPDLDVTSIMIDSIRGGDLKKDKVSNGNVESITEKDENAPTSGDSNKTDETTNDVDMAEAKPESGDLDLTNKEQDTEKNETASDETKKQPEAADSAISELKEPTEQTKTDENDPEKETTAAEAREKLEEEKLLQDDTEAKSDGQNGKTNKNRESSAAEDAKEADNTTLDTKESDENETGPTTEKTNDTEAKEIEKVKDENTNLSENKSEENKCDVEGVAEKASDETESETKAPENKRKLSIEDKADSTSPKKPKLDPPKCIRPRGVKPLYKGATFWPSNFRQKLCTCSECISMYKDLAVLFLIDQDDTVSAYEALGKERIDGPSSQYEKGLQALSSLDRVQQINALTEYNKMRDKLLDFLKSFKDKKEIVKEEDIKAFFAGMKPKREPDGVYFCR